MIVSLLALAVMFLLGMNAGSRLTLRQVNRDLERLDGITLLTYADLENLDDRIRRLEVLRQHNTAAYVARPSVN